MDSLDKACEQRMTVLDAQSQQEYRNRLEKLPKQQDQKMAQLLANTASLQADMEAQQDVEEMLRYRQIFRTSDYEGYKAGTPDRVPGTCLWLLDHPKYGDWRDQHGSSVLWVSGDPGCGKSVLSNYLIDQAFPPAWYTTCSFLFRDNNGDKRTPNMPFALYYINCSSPSLDSSDMLYPR